VQASSTTEPLVAQEMMKLKKFAVQNGKGVERSWLKSALFTVEGFAPAQEFGIDLRKCLTSGRRASCVNFHVTLTKSM